MKRQNLRTVSLIVVTFTYLLLGAAIFGWLESEYEAKQRDYLETIERIVKNKYNITDDDYQVLTATVIRAVPHKAGIQWRFSGAFYFATTVVTTIGYGHSTPSTVAGRSFCMIYALVGIPLGLIMFQSIGERLNTFVRFALSHFKRCLKARNQKVTQTNIVMVVSVLSTILMTSMAAVFAKYERWDYFDALYYCFITLTTIGFGDYVALQQGSALQDKPEYVALSLIFILFGLSVVSSAVNLLVLKFLALNTEDERRDEQLRANASQDPIRLEGDVITSAAGKFKYAREKFPPTATNTAAASVSQSRSHSPPQPPVMQQQNKVDDNSAAATPTLADNYSLEASDSSAQSATGSQLWSYEGHPYKRYSQTAAPLNRDGQLHHRLLRRRLRHGQAPERRCSAALCAEESPSDVSDVSDVSRSVSALAQPATVLRGRQVRETPSNLTNKPKKEKNDEEEEEDEEEGELEDEEDTLTSASDLNECHRPPPPPTLQRCLHCLSTTAMPPKRSHPPNQCHAQHHTMLAHSRSLNCASPPQPPVFNRSCGQHGQQQWIPASAWATRHRCQPAAANELDSSSGLSLRRQVSSANSSNKYNRSLDRQLSLAPSETSGGWLPAHIIHRPLGAANRSRLPPSRKDADKGMPLRATDAEMRSRFQFFHSAEHANNQRVEQRKGRHRDHMQPPPQNRWSRGQIGVASASVTNTSASGTSPASSDRQAVVNASETCANGAEDSRLLLSVRNLHYQKAAQCSRSAGGSNISDGSGCQVNDRENCDYFFLTGDGDGGGNRDKDVADHEDDDYEDYDEEEEEEEGPETEGGSNGLGHELAAGRPLGQLPFLSLQSGPPLPPIKCHLPPTRRPPKKQAACRSSSSSATSSSPPLPPPPTGQSSFAPSPMSGQRTSSLPGERLVISSPSGGGNGGDCRTQITLVNNGPRSGEQNQARRQDTGRPSKSTRRLVCKCCCQHAECARRALEDRRAVRAASVAPQPKPLPLPPTGQLQQVPHESGGGGESQETAAAAGPPLLGDPASSKTPPPLSSPQHPPPPS